METTEISIEKTTEEDSKKNIYGNKVVENKNVNEKKEEDKDESHKNANEEKEEDKDESHKNVNEEKSNKEENSSKDNNNGKFFYYIFFFAVVFLFISICIYIFKPKSSNNNNNNYIKNNIQNIDEKEEKKKQKEKEFHNNNCIRNIDEKNKQKQKKSKRQKKEEEFHDNKLLKKLIEVNEEVYSLNSFYDSNKEKINDESIIKEFQNLKDKYYNYLNISRFSIPIIGSISVGKSTLLNYLLNLRNFLQSGERITTRFFCIIRHNKNYSEPIISNVKIEERHFYKYNFIKSERVEFDTL